MLFSSIPWKSPITCSPFFMPKPASFVAVDPDGNRILVDQHV